MMSKAPSSVLARRNRRALSLAARLETLEARTLLSGITSYQNPNLLQPEQEAVDNSGNVWIADVFQLDEISKAPDGTVTTTVFPTDQLASNIVFDPVNNHLFASDSNGPLDEYDLSGNLLNQYTPDDPANVPSILGVATDGSIWFSTEGTFSGPDFATYNSNIGHMDLSGNFTFQAIPTDTQISSIAPAADGSVWFSTGGSDSFNTTTHTNNPGGPSFIGHAALAAGAITVTTYTIPQTAAIIDSIVVAPDGSLWFAVGGDSNSFSSRPPITEQIGHGTVTGSTLNVTTFDIPKTSSEPADTGPSNLAFDSTGLLWFADIDAIDNINTTTGDITRTSPNDPGSEPAGLVVSGNDVWITYGNGNNNLVDVDTTTFTPPIVGTDPVIAASSGQAFSGPVAIFASSDVGPFTYTINFGNGDTQTGTLPFNGTGVYTISGSTTYATTGNFNVSVSVATADGNVASFNGQAVVTNSGSIPLMAAGINLQGQDNVALPPNISGVSNLVVAQFSGPVASYSAVIHWGDSTSTTAQIVSLGSNQYYVELPTGTSKTYATIGTYNISVVITDGTNSVTATSTATIGGVPIVASQNLVLQPLLGPIVLNSVATFTANNASSANWFHATINWGDGTSSTGLVVKTSTGHYLILGLHIYARKGNYHVTTSILDTPENETATGTASVTIK